MWRINNHCVSSPAQNLTAFQTSIILFKLTYPSSFYFHINAIMAQKVKALHGNSQFNNLIKHFRYIALLFGTRRPKWNLRETLCSLPLAVTHIFFRRYYSPTLSPCFFIALIKCGPCSRPRLIIRERISDVLKLQRNKRSL